MAQTLAKKLAPLRVNVVSPGRADTPAYDWMAPQARHGMLAGASAKLLVGRTGRPAEIAVAVRAPRYRWRCAPSRRRQAPAIVWVFRQFLSGSFPSLSDDAPGVYPNASPRAQSGPVETLGRMNAGKWAGEW